MLKVQTMSGRGVLSLFGFGAALFAIPTTDAEAQTAGMERRHQRRQGRVERRYERRGGKSAQQPPAAAQPAQPAPAQKQ
jgi:hypothetical protein